MAMETAASCDRLPEAMDIQPMIRTIRGQQVMLDKDLAMLYGVETRRLNEQVKRNMERFPKDFMFQSLKIGSRNLRHPNPLSWEQGNYHTHLRKTELQCLVVFFVLKQP